SGSAQKTSDSRGSAGGRHASGSCRSHASACDARHGKHSRSSQTLFPDSEGLRKDFLQERKAAKTAADSSICFELTALSIKILYFARSYCLGLGISNQNRNGRGHSPRSREADNARPSSRGFCCVRM